MRLARLAAVGLAIGVIAGFAIALLRPRPQDRSGTSPDPADDPGGSRPLGNRWSGPSAALWANFQQAEKARAEAEVEAGRAEADQAGSPADSTAVLDVRASRRVTG
jgi:hypothetical protein